MIAAIGVSTLNSPFSKGTVLDKQSISAQSISARALSAVVVGADRLGNIPDLLRGHNISITHHISGRDPAHQKKTLSLPSGTQVVILLTDFLGHNVMKTFRNAAQKSGIKVVACRRSVCAMQQALEQCGLCECANSARCDKRRI